MSLPVLGVAVQLTDLETHLTLVRDHERDVELQSFIWADVLNGDWQTPVAKARTLLDGHRGRIGIHGPFFGFDLASTDPEVAAVVRKRLNQALDVVEALRGEHPHIVVHSPLGVWDHYTFYAMPHFVERKVEAFVANTRDAVARAEATGATFVLENIEDLEPARRRQLIERVGSSALKLSIDTGHANFGHGRFGAPPADAFVRDAGRLLGHMHLQDTDGYADRHWALGEGNIAWPEVFRALADSTALPDGGPDRPRLIIELHDKAGIPASIAHLNGLGLAQ